MHQRSSLSPHFTEVCDIGKKDYQRTISIKGGIITENCEYTIQAKGGAISTEQLEKMLLARFGMTDIEITAHRPLNLYDFPDREVQGLAEACKNEVSYWEGFDNTSGVMDVCDTDNERELTGKVYTVFRDEMSMVEAVKYTKKLLENGCGNVAAYPFDMDMERITVDGPEGVIAFCYGCSDKPIFGKCDLASACYGRQVFLRLRELEVKITNGELVERKPRRRRANDVDV